MQPKLRAVIYCRVSTSSDAQVDSLDKQIAEAEESVKQLGFDLVDRIIDDRDKIGLNQKTSNWGGPIKSYFLLYLPNYPNLIPKERKVPMAKVIAVMNEKGGVGKTATATTLAYLLSKRGHRTALVDFDGQGHSSIILGVTINTLLISSSNMLIKTGKSVYTTIHSYN